MTIVIGFSMKRTWLTENEAGLEVFDKRGHVKKGKKWKSGHIYFFTDFIPSDLGAPN